MPENPLLPDVALRTLLAQTRRCTALETPSRGKSGVSPRRSFQIGREALLAATTSQLEVGDLFVPEAEDASAIALAAPLSGEAGPSVVCLPDHLPKSTSRLLAAAAMAAALQKPKDQPIGNDPSRFNRVVLTLMRAGTADTAWQAALTWAQKSLLPLVVVCSDISGPAAFLPKPARAKSAKAKDAFNWTTVSPIASTLQLAVLTLDGDDAVAMYRATQEALLRARMGGGPAILWAALPTAAESAQRPRSQRALPRLAQYLRTRGISPS